MKKNILFLSIMLLCFINIGAAQNNVGIYSDYYSNNFDWRFVDNVTNVGGLYEIKNICDSCKELSVIIKDQFSFFSLNNDLKAIYNTIILNARLQFGTKYGYYLEGGIYNSYLIKEDLNNNFTKLKDRIVGLNLHNGFHYSPLNRVSLNLGMNIYFRGFRFEEKTPCLVGDCGYDSVSKNIYAISIALIYKL